MTLYSEKPVKAVRKARGCDGCGAKIEAGDAALTCAGVGDDGFWAATYHHDCREAEVALNKLHDTWDGEWMNLRHDLEWDDWPWLVEAFPSVAARMGITTERFQRISDEQEQIRRAFADAALRRKEGERT